MATRTTRTRERVRNEYNIDTLARSYSVEEEKRVKRYERTVRVAHKKARADMQAEGRINSGIDIISAVVLSLAIVCIAMFCLQYLVLESDITGAKKEVKLLSAEASALISENDEAYAAIESSVDIGYVYDVAVGELGMVFPDENQIVKYEYSENEYVRQYADVPEY